MTRFSQQGFTLIESVCVLLIMALFTLVAVTQSTTPSATGLDLAAKRIISDIYLTQEIGFVHHQFGRIAFINGATGYSIQRGNNARTYKTVELPAGVTITSADLDLRFRFGGQPATLSGGAWTFTTTVQSITITAGSASRIIDISPQTGYATVR